MRKLMANTAISYSQYGNCSELGSSTEYNPYSNISTVTSRRAKKNISLHADEYENVNEEEVNAFMGQLEEIQRLECRSSFTDLGDLTVAHIAGMIELRILNSNRFDCDLCKSVLSNDTKIRQPFLTSSHTIRPCQSTFDVCKTANHFLKIELLKGQFNMVTIQHAIITSLDLENLYSDADFLGHSSHKLYMIKYILCEYIRIKGMHLAETYNIKENQKMMRQKLSKLILHNHQ